MTTIETKTSTAHAPATHVAWCATCDFEVDDTTDCQTEPTHFASSIQTMQTWDKRIVPAELDLAVSREADDVHGLAHSVEICLGAQDEDKAPVRFTIAEATRIRDTLSTMIAMANSDQQINAARSLNDETERPTWCSECALGEPEHREDDAHYSDHRSMRLALGDQVLLNDGNFRPASTSAWVQRTPKDWETAVGVRTDGTKTTFTVSEAVSFAGLILRLAAAAQA